MDNNVNNMGSTISTQTSNVQPVSPQTVNMVNTTVPSQVANPQSVSSVGVAAPVVNAVPTNVSVAHVATTPVTNGTTLPQAGKKKSGVSTNTYLIVGFFVGFMLLASGFLLFLLLTGTIGGRNRLTFSKTINDVGYTHVAKRYYKFDGDIYTQLINVDTFTFVSLTDDEYNVRFDNIINNETNGITEYGFGTQISREGNVVTITSYNPNFFGDTKDDVLEDNEKEGFTLVK